MTKRISRSDSEKISKNQFQKASMALDDLVWTLQRLKIEQLKDAAEILRSSLEKDPNASSVAKGYKSSNPNKHFLIGVLPRLFQDRELFPQNEDIAEFANSILQLEINRTEKRSRYEIIGKVVCETDSLNDEALSSLVRGLEKLVEDKDKLALMIQKKRAGSFSWNETLQELLKA